MLSPAMKKWSVNHSVVSNSLPPHGLLQPNRLLCSWKSPHKNTGARVAIPFSRRSSLHGHLNLGLQETLHCRQILYPLSQQSAVQHSDHSGILGNYNVSILTGLSAKLILRMLCFLDLVHFLQITWTLCIHSEGHVSKRHRVLKNVRAYTQMSNDLPLWLWGLICLRIKSKVKCFSEVLICVGYLVLHWSNCFDTYNFHNAHSNLCLLWEIQKLPGQYKC